MGRGLLLRGGNPTDDYPPHKRTLQRSLFIRVGGWEEGVILWRDIITYTHNYYKCYNYHIYNNNNNIYSHYYHYYYYYHYSVDLELAGVQAEHAGAEGVPVEVRRVDAPGIISLRMVFIHITISLTNNNDNDNDNTNSMLIVIVIVIVIILLLLLLLLLLIIIMIIMGFVSGGCALVADKWGQH